MTLGLAPSLEEYLTKDVAAFLEQKLGPKPLGKSPRELLVAEFKPAAKWSDEEIAHAAALQQRLNQFTIKDKGVLAQLTSEYFRYRAEQFGVEGTSLLLTDGVDLWAEVAVTIGSLHSAGDSATLTRHKVQQNVARLHSLVDDATAEAEERLTLLLNARLAEEITRLETEMQATLAAERDQMTAAADAAQRDATDARRERDELEKKVRALEQQLKKVEYDQQKARRGHEQDLAELPRLRAENEQLTGQLRWLRADNAALKQKAETTAEQLQAAELQLLDIQTRPTLPTPEVPMPSTPLPPSRKAIPAPLADLSFVVFLKSRGHTASFEGGSVRQRLKKAEYDQLDAEWKAAIPDEAAALAQLRAVVQPLLVEVA